MKIRIVACSSLYEEQFLSQKNPQKVLGLLLHLVTLPVAPRRGKPNTGSAVGLFEATVVLSLRLGGLV